MTSRRARSGRVAGRLSEWRTYGRAPWGSPYDDRDSDVQRRVVILAAAIAPARGQVYRSVGIVVVDDGSMVPLQLDGVRGIRQENAGPAAARNAGIEAPFWNVVVCLDADDRLSSDDAERSVATLADPSARPMTPTAAGTDQKLCR
ncbi:glycosyltransferase family A protein [Ornithinimicrobium cerasi]|uniref:glycosyltransferase family A protein n=1 Tax=Ornithinimicrobium cerasi TaxID=2248773 RepID=UPI002467ED75|nr:glycosyltransferase family A protein [Ornithinimicrobium cerasi]